MSRAPYEDIEYGLPCGRCGHTTPYTEEPPLECENCKYRHAGRDHKDVPDDLRLKIHR